MIYEDRMKQTAPAKLTRPRSRGALPRERLFQSIHRSRQKKVIWISGPAGSGKTTLAASYFDSHQAPCLWYQLDQGDADLATFFYYLGLAAKHAAPRYRKPLPLLTPEYLLGVPVFAKRFFEQISSRLIGKTNRRASPEDGGSAIVLDNYQDVLDDSMFHDVLNAGLSATPEGLSVIILSRSQPPPAYARLRAAGEMSLLGWEEIRFTAEESNAISMLKAGRDLPGEVLSQLYQTTDGWAAGLVLLMESLGGEDVDVQLPRGLGREEIFGYFATELFERSSPEARTFLLETAFLPRMTARMAEELTGNTRAGRIFSDLNRKNYFTTRYTSAEQAFQYHPLFREFLLAKAQETMPAERLPEIRSRAANVLEKNGHAEEAVSLYCEAGMWPEAIRAILTQAPMLTVQGRWQTLRGWIESIPKAVTEHQPWLLYWMGICLLPISPDSGMSYFAKAYEQFRTGRDAAGSFLALSGMLDVVGFMLDRFIEFDRLIPMMNELMEEYPEFPSPMIEARVANSMLYAFMLRQPNNPDFKRWENRGLGLVNDMADMDLALRILCALALYHLLSGELAKVQLILDSFQKKLETRQATPVAVLLQRDLQVFYYWLSADFEKHRWAAEDGLALAESTGVHVVDVLLLGHGAAGALSLGEISKAEGYLEHMLAVLRMRSTVYGEFFYHNTMAWKCFLEGQHTLASMHADLAIERGAASGAPQVMPANHLIKAMVMHALRDKAEASLHLSKCLSICRSIKLYQIEFMGFLAGAKIAFDGGDEASGKEFLRKGLAIGREHGYATSFLWVNSMVANLCVKALEAGIETEYVQGLVRKRNLVPDMPVLHLENWPWPLKIFTLGQFEMMRDGEVVKFTGKVQQKPLLLLKALIAFGGRDVKEEQLCDALWPDAEGDLAHRSFETTLYRLRQLIGKDKAIQLKEGRLTLDWQACWVDAFALEQVLNEAEGLWEIRRRLQADPQRLRDATERVIQLTERAITLYQGHFLEVEPEQTWLLSPQERLRAKYIGGIESLAGHWEAAGELEMAIRCYEKALEVDDLVEEFYQRLMICHQQQGRRAKALAVYSRCRSVLEVRLGIEPSAKTEALLATLRSGR
jgi:LuxR family transcriptional regulator, maltose regulon positive regulatory protein